MSRYAHHIIAIDPAAPEWVHVVPAPGFAGRDGRGPYRYDTGRLLSATRLYHGSKPIAIDYDHASLKGAMLGAKAPAAGWIREFETRPDGIWGRVDWTEAAAAHIAAGEYLYLSPVIPDKDGELLMIFGAGLVNNPNLDLAPLRQIDAALHAALAFFSETNGADMEPYEQILADLGITEPSEAQIATAKAQAAHRALGSSALTALGLDETGTAEAVNEAVAGLKSAHGAEAEPEKTGEPDPRQYVPRPMFDDVAVRLKKLEDGVASSSAHSAVDAAIKAGKIAPAQKDWAHSYAVKDPGGFADFVAQQPVIVAPGSEAGHMPGALPKAEDAHAADIASHLGITVDDMTKANQEAAQ